VASRVAGRGLVESEGCRRQAPLVASKCRARTLAHTGAAAPGLFALPAEVRRGSDVAICKAAREIGEMGTSKRNTASANDDAFLHHDGSIDPHDGLGPPHDHPLFASNARHGETDENQETATRNP
jgi:hypothetical protein